MRFRYAWIEIKQ